LKFRLRNSRIILVVEYWSRQFYNQKKNQMIMLQVGIRNHDLLSQRILKTFFLFAFGLQIRKSDVVLSYWQAQVDTCAILRMLPAKVFYVGQANPEERLGQVLKRHKKSTITVLFLYS